MNAKKIALIAGVIILLGAIVGFTVNQSQKNVVTVQTGKVVRQDISSMVTASGEIRPMTYVNIGANAMGRITKLFVQEGDKVKKGQVLAQLENVDRKSTRLNSSHPSISYAVFCLKKKKKKKQNNKQQTYNN